MEESPAGSTIPAPMDVHAKPRSRQDIEILRILSAFGIVWFHAGRDTYGVGYGGLVVFLVLSSFFAASPHSSQHPWKARLLHRARRFLVPWAFWMVVFGIRNEFFIDRYFIETDRGVVNGILAGSNIHLWYLPYAFAVAVLLDEIAPRVDRMSLSWLAAAGAIALLVTSPLWRPWAESHGYPTVQYVHAVPAVLVGVFLAGAPRLGRSWTWTLLACILAAAGYAMWKNVEGVGSTYLAGTLVVSVVLLWRLPLPSRWRVDVVSGCAFGIYLCHPLYRGLYESIQAVPVWAEAWLTFASSLASVLVARLSFPKVVSWVC